LGRTPDEWFAAYHIFKVKYSTPKTGKGYQKIKENDLKILDKERRMAYRIVAMRKGIQGIRIGIKKQ